MSRHLLPARRTLRVRRPARAIRSGTWLCYAVQQMCPFLLSNLVAKEKISPEQRSEKTIAFRVEKARQLYASSVASSRDAWVARLRYLTGAPLPPPRPAASAPPPSPPPAAAFRVLSAGPQPSQCHGRCHALSRQRHPPTAKRGGRGRAEPKRGGSKRFGSACGGQLAYTGQRRASDAEPKSGGSKRFGPACGGQLAYTGQRRESDAEPKSGGSKRFGSASGQLAYTGQRRAGLRLRGWPREVS